MRKSSCLALPFTKSRLEISGFPYYHNRLDGKLSEWRVNTTYASRDASVAPLTDNFYVKMNNERIIMSKYKRRLGGFGETHRPNEPLNAREIVLAKIQNARKYFEKYIWKNLDPSDDQPKYGEATKFARDFKTIREAAPPVYEAQKKEYEKLGKDEEKLGVDAAQPTPANQYERMPLKTGHAIKRDCFQLEHSSNWSIVSEPHDTCRG